MIYADYMATTPLDRAVQAEMVDSFADFGNPSSLHAFGEAASARVEAARQAVAESIGALLPQSIIFTSGATEANNLALQGVAHFHARRGRHIVTMATEHKAILDVCQALNAQEFDMTYLQPDTEGRLDPEVLRAALRSDTILVSIMHVNNETGVIQDIKTLSSIAHGVGAVFHTDMAQSIGKIAVDVQDLGVDLASFCAHKTYGPKGVGALYVRRQPRLRLEPLLYGGGHEQGLRSGTLATHQIVGMGAAFRMAEAHLSEELTRITALRDQLWAGLSALGGVERHGSATYCVPQVLNVRFLGVEGESLRVALDPYVAVSSGSACNAVTSEPSHVLQALGLSRQAAHDAIRLSIGRFTTENEVNQIVQHFSEIV
ncbi:MAG: IscS subfamily cysteine desulfurase, partial [Gammaproteobacteria bacterium RIFCSPHIGHO2_12_FULL_45_9]